MKIKIKDISFPEHYVRGKPDPKRIDDFLRIAANLSPRDHLPKKPKLAYWPFPPVEVNKTIFKKGESLTSEPEKVKGKRARVKKLKPYELIDGRHRIETLKKMGIEEIEATVKSIKDAGLRYLEQFKAANTGPLPLGPLARAQAVWTMVNVFKVPQKVLVQETGLHKSSISRIAAKKQGWTEQRKPPIKRKGANGEKDEGGENGTESKGLFTPSQLFDRLVVLTGKDGYGRVKEGFLKHATGNVKASETQTLIAHLKALLSDLEPLLH